MGAERRPDRWSALQPIADPHTADDERSEAVGQVGIVAQMTMPQDLVDDGAGTQFSDAMMR